MPDNAPLAEVTIEGAALLPDGAAGVDAGLTLIKLVHCVGGRMSMRARERHSAGELSAGLAGLDPRLTGVTGAWAQSEGPPGAFEVQEIDAAVCGATALLRHGGDDVSGPFLLALLGTGTSFAAVRDGRASHVGGAAIGGGSFAGIAARLAPGRPYADLIAAAGRGDRRKVDVMVADAYPGGIGRVGADMTASHLARAGGGSLDDFLAGLLNLHGESIAQIGASRARIAGMAHMVLAGGFAHHNPVLTNSIVAMCGLFGVRVTAAPHPGYAGAVGAARAAVEHARRQEAT